MVNHSEQQLLLKLARDSIKNASASKTSPSRKYIPLSLKEKRGVFVTLEEDGKLRGCVGSLFGIKNLYDSVIENARHAAFDDPRFGPVTESELKDIRIEISILSEPKKLDYKNIDDLLNRLNNHLGVILKKGFASATFLPQVWEQLPDKKEFLRHLCMKAGLEPDVWKKSDLEILVYEVEHFSDNE